MVLRYPLDNDEEANGIHVERWIKGEKKDFVFINTSNSIEKQIYIKLMSDAIKVDKNNTGVISNNTIKKCANGVKWILGLKSMEHRVMGIKDFAANDRQSVTQMILSPDFTKYCPELLAFAQNNSGIFRR